MRTPALRLFPEEVNRQGHWVRWHGEYGDERSSLSRRLAVVQRRLRQALDDAPAGRVRTMSMCAGQGRDVLGVLVDHPRALDVTARLVELDPDLVTEARSATKKAHLRGVEIVDGDAACSVLHEGVVPANVVLSAACWAI